MNIELPPSEDSLPEPPTPKKNLRRRRGFNFAPFTFKIVFNKTI